MISSFSAHPWNRPTFFLPSSWPGLLASPAAPPFPSFLFTRTQPSSSPGPLCSRLPPHRNARARGPAQHPGSLSLHHPRAYAAHRSFHPLRLWPHLSAPFSSFLSSSPCFLSSLPVLSFLQSPPMAQPCRKSHYRRPQKESGKSCPNPLASLHSNAHRQPIKPRAKPCLLSHPLSLSSHSHRRSSPLPAPQSSTPT